MLLKPEQFFSFQDSNMKGAYSTIETHIVHIITERTIGGDGFAEIDAPCCREIDQEEFTQELAEETRQYC